MPISQRSNRWVFSSPKRPPFFYLLFATAVIVGKNHFYEASMTKKTVLAMMLAILSSAANANEFGSISMYPDPPQPAPNDRNSAVIENAYTLQPDSIGPSVTGVQIEEKPKILVVDVSQLSISGLKLYMDESTAIKNAQAHAHSRGIKDIGIRERDERLATLTWGNSSEETVVSFVRDISKDSQPNIIYRISYTYDDPKALHRAAVDKYGEPSIAMPSEGFYRWCMPLEEKPSTCDDRKADITLETRRVAGLGILTANAPDLLIALREYTPTTEINDDKSNIIEEKLPIDSGKKPGI